MIPLDLQHVTRIASMLGPGSAEGALESATSARRSLQLRIKNAEAIANGRPATICAGQNHALREVAALPDMLEALPRIESTIAACRAALPLHRARGELLGLLMSIATLERNAQPILAAEAEAARAPLTTEIACARYERACRAADRFRASIAAERERLLPLVDAWRSLLRSFTGERSAEVQAVDAELDRIFQRAAPAVAPEVM